MLTAMCIKDNGKMTYSRGAAYIYSRMAIDMKEIMSRANVQARAYSNMLMATVIPGIF